MSGLRIAPATVDVRDVSCPLTWVRTRIALEKVGLGERVVVLLREGEPLRNVPASAREEGHRVVSVASREDRWPGAWEVVLEKGAAPAALP